MSPSWLGWPACVYHFVSADHLCGCHIWLAPWGVDVRPGGSMCALGILQTLVAHDV